MQRGIDGPLGKLESAAAPKPDLLDNGIAMRRTDRECGQHNHVQVPRYASYYYVSSDVDEEFTLPVASGVVAGGSLMGVVLIFWADGGSILKTLFGG
jgi:hypothetical protein